MRKAGIVFFIVGLISLVGCVSGPDFEASVVSGEPLGQGALSEWTRSVDPVPYFSSDSSTLIDNTEKNNSEGDSVSGLVGSSGRGASVVKIDRPPYGTPVPGKTQLVRSPFTDQGFVDVSGHPPDMEVKCPYTGKVFLVP